MTEPKRPRGRPRKDPFEKVTSARLFFTTPYSTNGSYYRTAPTIAQQLRELAEKYVRLPDQNGGEPIARNLADWIGGIANNVEAGNSVEAGYCGLMALHELAALVRAEIEPFAQEGHKKLAADKRKGRRVKW